MKVFDTNVQETKYKVLKEVIKRADNGSLDNAQNEIAEILSPGPEPIQRYSMDEERGIIRERVDIAMGGEKRSSNPIQVIADACDACPATGMLVSDACRGCLRHSCMDGCPKNAITIVNHKCTIDPAKCISCGKCAQNCPYHAIIPLKRPCKEACGPKAIEIDENGKTRINDDKCVSCGACLVACPFGAIQDKSFLLDIMNMIKSGKHVYAVVAPAIASQVRTSTVPQVYEGIKKLGFYKVVEAAWGADMTLYREANEWVERHEEGKVLTTSCCPAFVKFIETQFPEIAPFISSSSSPMIETARHIKREDPGSYCVFVGPCSAKKMEFKLEKTGGAIDCVMSYEELQAWLDAREIDPSKLEVTEEADTTNWGRIFGKSGGITEGLVDYATKKGIEGCNPIYMSGWDEIRAALMKLKMNKSVNNFFEGMACNGGCLNGALVITRGAKNLATLDKYAAEAKMNDVEVNSNKIMDSEKNHPAK